LKKRKGLLLSPVPEDILIAAVQKYFRQSVKTPKNGPGTDGSDEQELHTTAEPYKRAVEKLIASAARRGQERGPCSRGGQLVKYLK